MVKRNRLEIIRDILSIVSSNHQIKPTPLLRQSNVSSTRFKEYYADLLRKGFIAEQSGSSGKHVEITSKGVRFLEKYSAIMGFIDEFEL